MADNFRQLQTSGGGPGNHRASNVRIEINVRIQSIDRRTAESSEAHGRSTQGTRYEKGDAISFYSEEGRRTRHFVSAANATEIPTHDSCQTEINQEFLTVNRNIMSNASIPQGSLGNHQPIVYSDPGRSRIYLQENCHPVIERPSVETMDNPQEGTKTQSLNDDWRLLEPSIRMSNLSTNNELNRLLQNISSSTHTISTRNNCLPMGEANMDFNQGSTAHRNLVHLNPSRNEEYRNLLNENCESSTKRRVVETMNNPLEVSLQLFNKQPSVNEQSPKRMVRRQETSEPTEHLNAAEQDGHASGVTLIPSIRCEKCGKRCRNYLSYNAHVQSNCDPKSFKCDCGLEFRYSYEFMNHWKRVHST